MSKQGLNWAGVLKSSGASTEGGKELEGTEREKEWDGVGGRDLVGASLGVGESDWEVGWDIV